MQELLRLFAAEAAHGNAGHLADAVADIALVDNGDFGPFFLQLLLAFGNLVLEFFLAGTALRRVLVILVRDSLLLFLEDFRKFIFHVHQILRDLDGIELHAGASLVEHVDGLVRQEALADIAFGKRHRGAYRIGRVMHLVVLLVLRAESLENLDGIFRIGRIHENRLEAAFQGRILLDILAVFVNRRRADALEFSTR